MFYRTFTPSPPLSDFVDDFRYYDHAHFTHDFKAFSGLNPTTYLTQRGENINHVPLPD